MINVFEFEGIFCPARHNTIISTVVSKLTELLEEAQLVKTP